MSGKTVEAVEKVEKTFSLPSKKVKLIPVIKNGWLPKGHEASFLYGSAKTKVSVPRAEHGGHYVNPLTKEEAAFLENHPALSLKTGDLSVHRKENNFWKDVIGMITLGKDERTFDLSDPMDYITYKVLLLQRDLIAPSAEDARGKLSYRYAFVDVDYEDDKKTIESNLLADAFMEYGKIRTDRDSLMNILYVLEGKRISPNSKIDFLQGQVGSFVTKAPSRFLEIINDSNLMTKVLLQKAIAYNIINRRANVYKTAAGETLGIDMLSTIDKLNDPAMSDVRIIIEEQVKKAESK
jgi:hypothetical protein